MRLELQLDVQRIFSTHLMVAVTKQVVHTHYHV
jgi:hypothetical protein